MSLLKQLLQLAVVVGVAVLGGSLTAAVADSWLLTLVVGIASATATLTACVLIVRATERRPVTELAREGAGRGLARGALLGTAMFTSVVAVIALLGGYHVEGWGSATAALGVMGAMINVAVVEELVMRGLLLRMIEQRAGTWVALVVTAVGFGALHLLNPDATLWGAVAITLEAGGLLGAAYVFTRSLWFAIGLHAAWNIAQSAIFSTATSGNGTPLALLDATTSGPVLLSGGAFGPEASAAAVLAGLSVTIVLLIAAHRRGHWVPMPRRAARTAATAAR
ncbi:CPBP family intramembrane glutamic endopeptidase [Agrococcus sp. ARC_14]|uniref:CPBP family intramembrane glutamic endopeptidase n=1 Tax=Agrococcus sp. ARC_14 TaxID=2919927 RepID=UPI001F05F893|nr:CPBP family intramembrane glutamic endopeptidase [Agrococcus sp. ARC_14]MCH1882527.1 CPBP family intramembrane metalloprotease [Agrococcus sp. ARC_14]